MVIEHNTIFSTFFLFVILRIKIDLKFLQRAAGAHLGDNFVALAPIQVPSADST
jgi:hypothetical protein